MTPLTELQTWFQQQCDGEWEHRYGVTIRSTDNPGWWITIDLRGTALEQRAFEPVRRGDFARGNPQPPWLHCYVKETIFHGGCDADRLEEVLAIFLAWARAA